MTQTVPAATAGALDEHVGDAAAVRSVADGRYARIMSNQRLAPYFTNVDMSQQKRHAAADVLVASRQVVTQRGDSTGERKEVI